MLHHGQGIPERARPAFSTVCLVLTAVKLILYLITASLHQSVARFDVYLEAMQASLKKKKNESWPGMQLPKMTNATDGFVFTSDLQIFNHGTLAI